jgi:RNA polymerase sigma-70 factor (ECF subfamily)
VALSREDLEHLYVKLERPLYNFALRWVWNPTLAQELVQESFVRIWSRRESVQSGTLQGLLFTTVKNLALNEIRKMRYRELLAPVGLDWLLGESTDVEQDWEKNQALAQMRRELESLPEELRETLLLCQFSEMTYEEIGRTLGVPPGTVASRRSRAMQILKQKMEASHE